MFQLLLPSYLAIRLQALTPTRHFHPGSYFLFFRPVSVNFGMILWKSHSRSAVSEIFRPARQAPTTMQSLELFKSPFFPNLMLSSNFSRLTVIAITLADEKWAIASLCLYSSISGPLLEAWEFEATEQHLRCSLSCTLMDSYNLFFFLREIILIHQQ